MHIANTLRCLAQKVFAGTSAYAPKRQPESLILFSSVNTTIIVNIVIVIIIIHTISIINFINTVVVVIIIMIML